MISWMIAFAIHSTLWCSIAWLVLRLRPTTGARVRETIWHTALLASFVTPTISSLTSSPTAWQLPILPAAIAAAERGHGEGVEGEHRGGTALAARHSDGGESAHEDGVVLDSTASTWPSTLGWTWVAIASILVLGYGMRLRALQLRLQRRNQVDDPRVLRTLGRMSQKAGLRTAPELTESDELGSPIAIGMGTRREICVPTRALQELDGEELEALLGHELAHHMRRDALRLNVMNTLQAVFFFQPLFRVAARDLQFAAEEQCDAWAANQLDDRFAMATCLTEVATWVLARDRRMPAPCMGRHRSQLAMRVHRLTDSNQAIGAPSRTWRTISSLAVVIVGSLLAPTVISADAAQEAHNRPSTESHRDGGHGEVKTVRTEHGNRERRSSEHDGEGRSSEHGDRERREEHRSSESREHRWQ